MKNKKETLELNILSKDWSAKSFDEDFGGLGINDFVDLYELGELYADEARANDTEDNSYEMLVELTGIEDTKLELAKGVNYSLLGIYLAIGSRIAEDRYVRALDPASQQLRDEWIASLANAQDALRALSPEDKQKFIDEVKEL